MSKKIRQALFYRGGRSALPSAGRRRFLRLVLVVPVVLSVYLFVGGEGGFYQIRHRDQQIASLAEDLPLLKVENAHLEQEVVRLETDLNEIERIARERYGMVKKDESVYMVYPHPPEKTP